MHHVFISYSRRQSTEVGAVVDAVASEGTPVWIDRADIPEGVPWERQLRRAIRESDLVAYFVSDDWLTSSACALEREITAEYGKAVLPIRMPDDGIDVRATVAEIRTAHIKTPPHVSEHTDLECAAAEWSEANSSKRRLARGVDLRRFKAATSSAIPVTEVARRFLAVSTRAARLRRADALLGSAVLVLAVTTVRALPDALAHSREARESLVAALAEYTALDAAAERGPYDALAAALALPEDAQGHFYHAALIEAASAKTPVDRGQLGDQTSAPFSFGDDQMRSSSDELAVVAQVDGKSAHVVLVDADTEALTASVVLPGTGRAAMFSPDGLTVAALSANGITLIDARHGTVWQELTGADFTALDDVAWSGDGRQVAAMDSSSGQVIVWQVLTETEVLARTNLWIMDSTTLGAAGGGAFLGRDGRIAVVGLSGTSAVDIVDGVLPAGVAGDIASSPSGTTAYVTFQPEGGAFGLVSIDLSSRSATPLPLPDGCSPRTVAVGPEDDGRIFVACGGRLVAVSPAGDVVSDTQTSIDHISTITVAADGTVFAGAAGGGAVTAFAEGITEQTTRGAIVTGSGLEVGTCGGGTPLVLRALPDSSRVYSVGQGTGLQLCARVLRRTNGGWEMSTPPVTDDSATQGRGLAVSPDGSLAAIGLADGSVQIVSAADSSIGWRWTEQYGEVRGVEFSLDSSYVVVGTRDGLITRVPAVADRLEASALRRVAQEMLDRATDLGFYAG